MFNPPVSLCAGQETASQTQKQRSRGEWGGSVVPPHDLVEVRQASERKLSSIKEDYGKSNSKQKSTMEFICGVTEETNTIDLSRYNNCL